MERTWLVNIRTDLELTHDFVAGEAKISRQYYGMIESGLRNPSVDLAKRIAKALKFNWTLFFEEKGNETFQENSTSKEVG